MPKITVYIPTHNYGRFLDHAINSVIQQTMTDWELIVIDDGSTDNTSLILEKYRIYPQLQIIEQSNKGLNVTNNIAIRLARGKYIIRLDADDYFDENILLVLSNVLDRKPDVALVFPDYYHVDESGEIIEIIRRKKLVEEVELLDLPAHGACTMFRKECLTDLKGYQEIFSCQDGYELWLRFIREYKPYNVNVPLFYYRQHASNSTKDQEKILETRRRIKRDHVNNFNGGKRPKVLGLVPIASKSIYPVGRPFDQLAGKPLLWYTLSEATKSQYLDRIVVCTEDASILSYVQSFGGLTPVKRPIKLALGSSDIQSTINYTLDKLKANENYIPDAVCSLYITTPLRKAKHIDKAIDTFTIFDVQSVISVCEELSHCYQHRRFGLERISNSGRNFRIERDAIYKENGAIYLTCHDVLSQGDFIGKNVSHILMLPQESVKVNSEYEFWLTERILTDWPATL